MLFLPTLSTKHNYQVDSEERFYKQILLKYHFFAQVLASKAENQAKSQNTVIFTTNRKVLQIKKLFNNRNIFVHFVLNFKIKYQPEIKNDIYILLVLSGI